MTDSNEQTEPALDEANAQDGDQVILRHWIARADGRVVSTDELPDGFRAIWFARVRLPKQLDFFWVEITTPEGAELDLTEINGRWVFKQDSGVLSVAHAGLDRGEASNIRLYASGAWMTVTSYTDWIGTEGAWI